jgi:hypothetical protein
VNRPEPRLFHVPRQSPLLLVLNPDEGGYVRLVVRRGWNPLQDEEPTEYERCTVEEVLDVIDAEVLGEFGPLDP